MRQIVLSLGMSIDGYIARRDGSVDFLFMPEDFSMAPFFETIDTVIMGRKTLDIAIAMNGGTFDGMGKKTYVFTHGRAAGVAADIEYVNGPVEPLARTLLAYEGKDIWLMGGGDLGRQFLQADLVDRVDIGIVPTLLGDGIPLFPGGFPQRDFDLISCNHYSRGLVTVSYLRRRA
ncbi:MAG: dihydrofolate reductase [Bryobacterales bacterium]|nr:dihydrofolate reductase [Bryobacterales bacterium]